MPRYRLNFTIVKSINGVLPDKFGNVVISTGGGGTGSSTPLTLKTYEESVQQSLKSVFLLPEPPTTLRPISLYINGVKEPNSSVFLNGNVVTSITPASQGDTVEIGYYIETPSSSP